MQKLKVHPMTLNQHWVEVSLIFIFHAKPKGGNYSLEKYQLLPLGFPSIIAFRQWYVSRSGSWRGKLLQLHIYCFYCCK